MFIRNAWYVAARTEEVAADSVLHRHLLGESLVLFRGNDGTVGALADRCSHRLARLSQGKCIDGTLQCGYHGARFSTDGSCIEFPGQNKVLQGANVRCYPVRERYGLIWVWPGAPERSDDESSIPDFLAYGVDPHVPTDGEMMGFGSDYRLLVDNLLDASHAAYVHQSTFGSPVWLASGADKALPTGEGKFDFQASEQGIAYQYQVRNGLQGPAFVEAYARCKGIEPDYHKPIDIALEAEWRAPGVFIFLNILGPLDGPDEERVCLTALHFLSPESQTTTNYYFRTSYRLIARDDGFGRFWHETASRAFHEDKPVLEAQQENIGAVDLYDHAVVSYPSDHLAIQGRRVLERLVAAEDSGAS